MAPTLPAVTVLQPRASMAGPQAVFALEASKAPAADRTSLYEAGVTAAGKLAGLRDGVRVRTSGEVLALLPSGAGLLLSLEDESGIAIVLASPKLALSRRPLLSPGTELLVTGRLLHRSGSVRVRAERIDLLHALPETR